MIFAQVFSTCVRHQISVHSNLFRDLDWNVFWCQLLRKPFRRDRQFLIPQISNFVYVDNSSACTPITSVFYSFERLSQLILYKFTNRHSFIINTKFLLIFVDAFCVIATMHYHVMSENHIVRSNLC